MTMEKQSYVTRLIKSLRSRGLLGSLGQTWIHFWMLFVGTGPLGRLAAWLVTWFAPPHYDRWSLRSLNAKGFVAPSATLYGKDICLGSNVFIDDHSLLFQCRDGGRIDIGAESAIFRNTIIQTSLGGSITIGEKTRLQPHCFLSAAQGSIRIGSNVGIAPYCAFYPHDHGTAGGQLISNQPLVVKGDIVVEDGAWLGHGVTVLTGVRIGKGAVIGAGSTVADDVPDGVFAWGVPARVFMKRSNPAEVPPLEKEDSRLTVNIADQVRTIASDVFMQDESSRVPPEVLDDWDSIQRLDLVLALETHFGVELAPAEIERMKTLDDFATVVDMKRGQGRESPENSRETTPKRA
jgi:acetyltransferase-like isoleucine patch superfamily enzyme/acyl carrier protein